MRTMAHRGMVASPHYLATGAGVDVLRRGGSAVDAAIAANSVLAVVTPYLCGIGGDLFALIYAAGDGELVGLNGSGRAPAEATPGRVRDLTGADVMPTRGPLSITVPGCIDAWGRLHERYGRLPLHDVLRDAIHYAADGFPVSSEFSASVARSAPLFHRETPARETFLPAGFAPVAGSTFRYPRLAATLRTIAEDGPEAYYRGNIAREIVRSVRAIGGVLTLQDLGDHQAQWVQPLTVRYHDVDVFELPPNSQGIVALMMLNMLQHLPFGRVDEDEDAYVHFMAEIARLAHADREAHLTDPDFMTVEPIHFLSDRYASARVAEVTDRASGMGAAGQPGDTIYLCVADADGNLVSLIESNYMGIGSGVMAGETGIMLQNRAAWFSLDPQHVNVIAPRKRTMHTLMPGMAFLNGRPWLVFGTMGGGMQAQIHVQLLTRLIDSGMPLDEAIAAPRFDAVAGKDEDGRPLLLMEGRFASGTMEALRRRGHAVRELQPYTSAMGHAHAIQILENGVLVGASDPRTDSLALGY